MMKMDYLKQNFLQKMFAISLYSAIEFNNFQLNIKKAITLAKDKNSG